MGLAKPALRFIAREHKRKPFADPVLTLGRQNVYARLDEVRQLLVSEGIKPAVLPPGQDTRSNIPNWNDPSYKLATSDVVFFKLLGLSNMQAMDYSNYEQAEIVQDLNVPVPDELKNRFSLIVDGGTLEHVFDVKQALMNVALMLKPGGRVIHMSPTNNYVNHGFYQFSPTLFFDYYSENAFTDLRGFIIEHDTYAHESRPWEIFEATASVGQMTSKESLAIFFVAEKTPYSTVEKIPLQSAYKQLHQSTHVPRITTSVTTLIKQRIPRRVRIFLKRYLPGVDPMKKPWGLRRLGRWT